MDFIKDILLQQVLGPVLSWVVPTVAAFAIGWAAVLYTKITGQDLDAGHRASLQSALENGMNFAIQAILNGVIPAAPLTPLVQQQLTAKAAEYVKTSVPDAVTHFKLDDYTLAKLLVPKLPVTYEKPAAVAPVAPAVSIASKPTRKRPVKQAPAKT